MSHSTAWLPIYTTLLSTFIVIIVTSQRRRLVSYLRERGAVDEAHATELGKTTMGQRGILRRLRSSGAIRTDAAGRYYLDDATLSACEQQRRGRAAWLIALLVLLACAGAILLLLARH